MYGNPTQRREKLRRRKLRLKAEHVERARRGEADRIHGPWALCARAPGGVNEVIGQWPVRRHAVAAMRLRKDDLVLRGYTDVRVLPLSVVTPPAAE